MSDFEILNERELEHLCRSPGDDVDMSLVSCVVAEIRATRSALATSTALADEQAIEIERLRALVEEACGVLDMEGVDETATRLRQLGGAK